ncbi:hypothetical protein [Marinilactibacillus kalidii]|uniref:hypothetical protein n=1 Tax=Marinilactibacillus kalidii TaxID=2820274 RepID=UPI001ABDD3DB|nr:hypothetical protein [Marinilactibacillus kalidii]
MILKNIETLLVYKDNFPEEYTITNEEAVNLIDYLKTGATAFAIDGDDYQVSQLSSIGFTDIYYENKWQSLGLQFYDASNLEGE